VKWLVIIGHVNRSFYFFLPLVHACQVWLMSVSTFVSYPVYRMTERMTEWSHNLRLVGGSNKNAVASYIKLFKFLSHFITLLLCRQYLTKISCFVSLIKNKASFMNCITTTAYLSIFYLVRLHVYCKQNAYPKDRPLVPQSHTVACRVWPSALCFVYCESRRL